MDQTLLPAVVLLSCLSYFSSESLNDELRVFLDAGDPPLLITLGSMPYDSDRDLVTSKDL